MTLATPRNRYGALAAMLITGLLGAQTPLGFDAPVVLFSNTDSSMVELLDFNGDGVVDSVNIRFHTGSVTLSVRSLPATAWLHTESFQMLSVIPRTAVGTVGAANAFGDFAIGYESSVRVYVGAAFGPYPVHALFTETAPVRGVAIRDFDGDGLGDVAVLTDAALVVHRYVSPGTFSAVTFALTPSTTTTTQLVAGDTNADGVADLVVVGGSCKIFTMSAGALVQGATYVHGVTDPMPTIGDVDGDGDEDLVVFGMTHYVVFRHTTPGTFVLEALATGGPATHLYDVDGDGDLDGACCGGGGGGGSPIPYIDDPSIFRVSVNQGGGAFAPAFELRGIGALHLAGVADINGDGIKDLAAGRCVYFPTAPLSQDPWLPGPGLGFGHRRIVDAEQDGDPDWSFGIDAMSWNTGDGLAISGAPVLLTPPAPGTTYTAPGYPGDWDGDGDDDLLVEHMAGPTFLGMVFLRNVGGAFSDAGPAFPPSIQFSPWIGNDPERTIAADVDGDGDLDIVGRSPPGPGFWSVVSLNAGNGTFTPTEAYPLEVIMHVADFTLDGHPDYLVSDGRLMFRRGLTGGGHGPLEFLAPSVAFHGFSDFNPFNDSIAVADFNGDGRLDFVASEMSGGGATPTLMIGTAPGSPYPFQSSSSIGGLNAVGTNGGTQCFAGDVDGDGLADLVVKDPFNAFTYGAGIAFSRLGNPAVFDGNLTRQQVVITHALSDVDGDGDADVIGPKIVKARGWEGPSAGSRVQYGAGIAGTGGVVPTLGETGPFRPGSPGELRIRGGLGGAAGYLALGFAAASTPLFGGTLLITPDVVVPIQLGGLPGVPGAGALSSGFVFPPEIAGMTIFHQAGFIDPAAPSGVSATAGLAIHVGQ